MGERGGRAWVGEHGWGAGVIEKALRWGSGVGSREGVAWGLN